MERYNDTFFLSFVYRSVFYIQFLNSKAFKMKAAKGQQRVLLKLSLRDNNYVFILQMIRY